MEDFHRCFFKILCSVFLFLNLFSVFRFLSAYTLPEQYFINCGSNSSSLFGNRTFVSDENSVLVDAGGGTVSDSDPNPTANLSVIYQTARIFKNPSYYELETDKTGIYVVRLHFYPFSSSHNNLTNARFNVVVSKLKLLSDFSVPDKTSVVVKEFFVSVKENKFRVEFNPSSGSSLAFINAIEVFLAPDNFIPGSALSGTGDNVSLLLNVFQVIHRINVGGSAVSPGNDTLMRQWVPDDSFLFSKDIAKNATPYAYKLNYFDGGATEFYAPDYVYKTAKESSKTNQNGAQSFNMTWSFNVEEGVKHFVRLHFCNIISEAANGTQFNLYVNGGVSKLIRPQNYNASPASPFYIDCVVDSDSSGLMNVSIGLMSDQFSQTAFLNGVEIMQVIGNQDSGGKKRVFVVIGVVAGCLVVTILSGTALFVYLKSRRRKSGEGDGGGTEMTSMFCMSPDMNLELRVPLVEVILATNNFDPKNMIGEGGFGKVYKGTLQNGVKVAVKRSEPGHGQGLQEFHTEILVLSRIRHRHLVSLIGYCSEQDEMILVYEFMEKGTLRDHLYNFKPRPGRSGSFSVLSWDQRLEICIGAAKGLHYLHTGLDGPIIHRDIKSANILLDENYVAKVADFGLSRSGPNDLSHISTDVKGSFGYLDPEYFRSLQLTQKSDVYSFGVVLLEAVCARPAINNMLPREEVNLADWGMLWLNKGQLDKIIDPLLVGKIDPNSLRKFGETVEKCLQEHGVDRPNMVDVVWDLKYALQLHHSATRRELQPEDDSKTGYSWQLPPPVFNRFPSHIMPIDRDEESQHLTDSLSGSHSSPSAVFSQLRINDAR